MESLSKKPFHHKIQEWVRYLISYLMFHYHKFNEIRSYGRSEFKYSLENKGKEAYILANGPSLKEEVTSLINGKIKERDFLVVNAFSTTEYYSVFSPKYYCIADPRCFDEKNFSSCPKVTVKTFEKINNSTEWPMTLFVPLYGMAVIKKYISNPLISIKGISTVLFGGIEFKKYQSYKKGHSVPSFVNITIMALYLIINMGYEKIHLYGVDHSFLAGLSIDDDNELCMFENHFYGREKHRLNIVRHGYKWKISDFVYDKYLTFKEHENMRGYADYLGVEIINHTRDSWIDAYTRISQIEKENI